MDTDGDRTLGPSEIMGAFRVMKKMKGAMDSAGISIDSFPVKPQTLNPKP